MMQAQLKELQAKLAKMEEEEVAKLSIEDAAT